MYFSQLFNHWIKMPIIRSEDMHPVSAIQVSGLSDIRYTLKPDCRYPACHGIRQITIRCIPWLITCFKKISVAHSDRLVNKYVWYMVVLVYCTVYTVQKVIQIPWYYSEENKILHEIFRVSRFPRYISCYTRKLDYLWDSELRWLQYCEASSHHKTIWTGVTPV